MRVKDLIRELRKFPQDHAVAFASHDNYGHEVQGFARSVQELEPGEARDRNGPCVVLRG